MNHILEVAPLRTAAHPELRDDRGSGDPHQQAATERGEPRIAYVSGVPVVCTDFETVVRAMGEIVAQKDGGHYISITNTEAMYHALRQPWYMDYIRKADFSCCDGIGSVVAGYAWGESVPRLNGPILMLKACDYGRQFGWRHFFYGATDTVVKELERRLRARYPGLISVGAYSPPFRPLSAREDDAEVAMINAAHPDVVWVGLGLVKQEKWIAGHLGRVAAPWMIGVGAAFDYHSGNVPWAPAWMQRLGLEWLFRMIIQPHRRYKRYYWSLIFVCESVLGGLWQRLVGRRRL
jgi:N-acetylglucosaminyldiphosphoundecaprenol N-acetyl-beta-D-mannosaminyltransferase